MDVMRLNTVLNMENLNWKKIDLINKRRKPYIAISFITNAVEELKRLSQNYIQKCFQHFYCRSQKYILAQWDYIEGNVATLIVLLCIYHNTVIPGIF
jgi:hypothetical protein